MKTFRMLACVLLAMGLPLLFAGCDSGGGGDDGAKVDVTGIWKGLAIGQNVTATLNVTQTGKSVTGSWTSNIGRKGPFTGAVHGNDLTGTLTSGSFSASISGPVIGNTATGKWTDSDGNQGTYTATRQ